MHLHKATAKPKITFLRPVHGPVTHLLMDRCLIVNGLIVQDIPAIGLLQGLTANKM